MRVIWWLDYKLLAQLGHKRGGVHRKAFLQTEPYALQIRQISIECVRIHGGL